MSTFEEKLSEALGSSRRLAGPVRIGRESLNRWLNAFQQFGKKMVELVRAYPKIRPTVVDLMNRMNARVGRYLVEENLQTTHDDIERLFAEMMAAIGRSKETVAVLRQLDLIHREFINKVYVPLGMTVSVEKPIA